MITEKNSEKQRLEVFCLAGMDVKSASRYSHLYRILIAMTMHGHATSPSVGIVTNLDTAPFLTFLTKR